MVGEGENMREDILAKVVRARKDGQELYKEEGMILPNKFLPELQGIDFLSLVATRVNDTPSVGPKGIMTFRS